MRTIKKFSDFVAEQLQSRPASSPSRTTQQPRNTQQNSGTTQQPVAPSAEAIAAEKAALVKYFDDTFKAMSEWLQNMYGDGESITGNTGFWKKFKGPMDDNEETAWAGIKAQWELDFGPAFKTLETKKNQLATDVKQGGKYASDETLVNFSKKVEANFKEISSWWTDNKDDSLYDTHSGANDSDLYSWSMNYSTGLKSYTIDCDF